jgi:hypothetical protein
MVKFYKISFLCDIMGLPKIYYYFYSQQFIYCILGYLIFFISFKEYIYYFFN